MQNKLQIGCFGDPFEGWHNTDITPHLWLSRIPGAALLCRYAGLMSTERYKQHRDGVFKKVHYLNATRRFPYANDSFEAVFCSHILEHVHIRFVSPLFREVLRVLEPGGIFRVVVPSLELAISSYRPDAPETCLELIFENTHKAAKNTHKWMYTEQSLSRVFREAGFINVSPRGYRCGRLPDVQKIDNRPENSIYVEGEKPGLGPASADCRPGK